MIHVSEKDDSLTSDISSSSHYMSEDVGHLGDATGKGGSTGKRRASAMDKKRDSSPILFEVLGLDD